MFLKSLSEKSASEKDFLVLSFFLVRLFICRAARSKWIRTEKKKNKRNSAHIKKIYSIDMIRELASCCSNVREKSSPHFCRLRSCRKGYVQFTSPRNLWIFVWKVSLPRTHTFCFSFFNGAQLPDAKFLSCCQNGFLVGFFFSLLFFGGGSFAHFVCSRRRECKKENYTIIFELTLFVSPANGRKNNKNPYNDDGPAYTQKKYQAKFAI